MEPPLIRTSERKTFRRCPQQWWWAFREGLRTRRKPADALWFGTGVHEALAGWYGLGFDRPMEPWKIWNEWVGEEVRYIKANYTERDREWFEEPAYEEARALGNAMLHAYVKEYGDDPDLDILAIEQPFEIDIVRNDEVIAVFAGRIDGVAWHMVDEEIYLLEHKTAGSIKTAHLPLDDQAGGYFSVATHVLRAEEIIGPNDYIYGIMYNFLRKARPDERPRNAGGAYLNKDGTVSKKQPARAFHREPVDRSPREVNNQLRRIADEVHIMNLMRAGVLPVTKSVTDMCPNCPFYTMCLLHERGGKAWQEYKEAEYEVEDPYLDHRKSAAE